MSLQIEHELEVPSEPCVAAWDEKLFVGSADGTIKAYDADLSEITSWPAHSTQIFAIAAAGGMVYSSSNDGGVRVWSQQGEKIAEFPSDDADVGALFVSGKLLFSGDETGVVKVYEDNVAKAKYNVLEEVKDICYSEPFLFTVRDLYVTVTEIKPEESKTRFVTRFTMEGRAPMRIDGSRLLVTARAGKSLQLREASIETAFKLLDEVKVSDMIVTSLTTCNDYVWTGTWDGCIQRWKISDKLEAAGEISAGSYVNALVSANGKIYATISEGKILRFNNQ